MLTALFAAVATTASAPTDLTDVRWAARPNGDDFASYYPAAAANQQINGRATIRCVVSLQGRVQQCVVISEDPVGMGFGQAALKMAPRFAMKPLKGYEGRPLPTIKIPIHFSMPGDGVVTSGNVNWVRNPTWRSAPTYDEVLAAWRESAGPNPAPAVFDCHVLADGHLDDCVARDGPPPWRQAMATAAKPLLPRFQVRVDPTWDTHGLPIRVNVPIKLVDPASPTGQEHRISEPAWVAAPDAEDLLDAYPEAARAKGVTTGRGVIRCVVASDGGLNDCEPASNPPDPLGFDEAANRVAGGLRMSVWGLDGSPVVGARIRLPIRFIDQAPTTSDAPPGAAH